MNEKDKKQRLVEEIKAGIELVLKSKEISTSDKISAFREILQIANDEKNEKVR